MQEGGMIVPALEDRPALLPSIVWFYECFQDLCNDRAVAPEGIPLSLTTGDIGEYFDRYELAEALTFEEFSEKIRLIDGVWLTATLEVIAQKRKDAEQQAKNKGRR